MAASERNRTGFRPSRALKYVRVAVSLCMFALTVTLLTAAEARLALALDGVAHIQIIPLVLAGSITGTAFWTGITMLFGRIYCSSVCPMGTLQDVFSRLSRLTRRQRAHHPFHHSAPRNSFRYAFLTAVTGSIVVGMSIFTTLFDPYSSFSRICTEIALPVKGWMTSHPVFTASWLAFGIASLTMVLTAWFSFRHGRIICNTVCPVGNALSLFSRFSLFHFDIDTDLCVNCRKCEHACKAECINMADHVVDGSRCVACFNCVDVCDSNAISYTTRRKHLSLPMMQRIESAATPINKPEAGITLNDSANREECAGAPKAEPLKVDRRHFLATGLIVAATPALTALADTADRLAAIKSGRKPLRQSRAVTPPGRRSMHEFQQKCTGCGLCVAHCPSKVLRPAANQLGWFRMLHPIMDYDRSHCLYDCTRCTDLCPTGALLPLTAEEKRILVIGHASTEPANCIGCGRCAAACPRKAISMVPRTNAANSRSQRIASVDTSLCIGCGACQHACPATPCKAIVVNGIV